MEYLCFWSTRQFSLCGNVIYEISTLIMKFPFQHPWIFGIFQVDFVHKSVDIIHNIWTSYSNENLTKNLLCSFFSFMETSCDS